MAFGTLGSTLNDELNRLANGQESITLKNGARYEIAAATRDAPRGKTADFLYLDELREWSEEAFTAALPVTRARPNSMTRFRTVEGQMVGLPMPGTIATILALTTSRMQRDGFVPWMYQFTWASESKCMTWSISYEYMPSEEDRGGVSPISSSTVEYVHHYTAGDTESTVGLTLIAHTPT